MTIQAWAEFLDSKKKADILRQLHDLGYDLTQRTFYRHCAQGKCRVGKSGLYTRRQVKSYVEAEGIVRLTAEIEDETEAPSSALSVEKQILENEKLRLHNESAAMNNRKQAGLLIEREALYLELAARVVALDNGFRQMVEVNCPAMITAMNGDMGRQPEFSDLLLTYWNDLLNSFATTEEFEVLFQAEQDQGDTAPSGQL